METEILSVQRTLSAVLGLMGDRFTFTGLVTQIKMAGFIPAWSFCARLQSERSYANTPYLAAIKEEMIKKDG